MLLTPLTGIVMPFVPELYSDAVVGKGEEFLAQPVALLALPLPSQEIGDGVAPDQEGVPVAPDGVLSVGQLDLVRVPSGFWDTASALLTFVVDAVATAAVGGDGDKHVRGCAYACMYVCVCVVRTYLVFQPSCADLTFICAVSAVKGGKGGLPPASCSVVMAVVQGNTEGRWWKGIPGLLGW